MIDQALVALKDQSVNDVKLVYKLYKLKTQTEQVLKPVYQLIKGKKLGKELNDLLAEEEALEIEPLNVDELSAFSLSMETLAGLEPILTEEKENK